LVLLTAGMGVWVAFDRETAWARFWLIVGAVALYYALVNQPTTRHLYTFSAAFALFGLVFAGYFLWTNDWSFGPKKVEAFTRLGEQIQAFLPHLDGHRMHPNVVSGVLALIVPFQIALLSRAAPREFRPWRWPAALALAVTSVTLVMTTSRGAWLAIAAGLGLWGLWKASGAFPWPHWPADQSAGRVARLGVLLLLVVLVGGVVVLILPGGLGTFLGKLPGTDNLPDRVSVWQRAFYLIQDTPFTGGGLGSFPALDAAYAHPITRWSMYWADVWVPNAHAHNLWLQVAVEQGLPGLGALLWLLGAFACVAWRGIAAISERRANPQEQLLLEAALISALILLSHGLFDDTVHASRGVLFLFVPMGLVVALAPHGDAAWMRRQARAGVLVLGIGLSLAALIWHTSIAAAVQANLGAVTQAQAELAGYRTKTWSLEQARRTGDQSLAVAWFQRALGQDAWQPTANLRLGLLYLGRGEYEAALPLLERAYELRPDLQAAQQALAEVYLAVGRLDESAALWAGVDDALIKLQQTMARYRRSGDAMRAADAGRVLEIVAGKG
ncbi:MAG: tetratricopeptide repeat protein, partial [Chloroflexi bacterium]|nr:tetratricopeptide repeat protein [Chloroflexota bacterium]